MLWLLWGQLLDNLGNFLYGHTGKNISGWDSEGAFWATFIRKFVAKTFQKLSNLVTLTVGRF